MGNTPVPFEDMYQAFDAFLNLQTGNQAPNRANAEGKANANANAKGKGNAGAEKKNASPEGGDGAKQDKAGDGQKKGKKEKKAKGDKKPAAAKEEKPTDVAILDIKIGKILKVENHPDADGLYVEQIDLGEAEPRQVVSGLRKFVPIEQMQDRVVVVILNLKPAKMRSVMSYGMVLCASNEDHTQVEPLVPPSDVAIGEKVTFEGFSGEPEAVINPKKKQLEKLFPDLKTTADGVAMYKEAAFMTTKGPCTSALANAWVR